MQRKQVFALAPTVLCLFLSASGMANGDFSLKTIASFSGPDGSNPFAGVTVDARGNLYGTTYSGGAKNDGTVYKIAAGTGTLSTIASFNLANGAFPYAGLTIDAHGNLYGTTFSGGPNSRGTVFEIAAGTGTLKTIASFGGTNGATPFGGVTVDARGNLYGTTYDGGAKHDGTVFEIVAGTDRLKTIASFRGANGASPYGGLTIDARGNLYGTTFGGGSKNDGTVFEIAAGTRTISTIASFNGTDGAQPHAGLTLDAQGNLYGTTGIGGSHDLGTVFEIAAGTTTLKTIASFNATNGLEPLGGLTVDSHGNLYGTTSGGGAHDAGTAYEIAAGTRTISTIASFNGTGGGAPYAGLTPDAQGNLYGTTSGGGPDNVGTVFELVNNSAVVPEPASIVALGQAATLLGIALAARARARRVR